MTLSDEVQIPIGQLQIAGRSLDTVFHDLSEVEKTLVKLSGTDQVHGFRMSDAVDTFFSEWKQARHILLLNIDGLGEISTQIAENASRFDAETATGLGKYADDLEKLSSQLSGSGEGGSQLAKPSNLAGICRAGSPEDVYAFRNSTAEDSQTGILEVMDGIHGTFAAILKGVEELKPQWEATEADSYFEAVQALQNAGDQIAEILAAIEESLGTVREGSDDLRQGILDVLEECE
ncbi:MAG: hypothetical protein Q4A92_08035 [Corynebacterium sp.]|nr:hypothetical protein [Corynebacterium sp.]